MSQYNLELVPRQIGNNDESFINQRLEDGYVNATAMCTLANKRFNDYRRLNSTEAFISELVTVTGIPATVLIQTIQGGDAALQGTWVHPDVAVHLAQWCSPIFAVKVNQFVREWLQGKTIYQEQLKSWQHFHDRVDMTRNSVPPGFFGVFNEIAGMIVPMINSGVNLNEHTIPDISVGKIWSSHWEKNNFDNVYGARKHYPHEYPIYYPQHAAGIQSSWCYPESALGEFRKWFRDTYQPNKLPQYLTRKQKKGDIEATTANKLIDTFSPKSIK